MIQSTSLASGTLHGQRERQRWNRNSRIEREPDTTATTPIDGAYDADKRISVAKNLLAEALSDLSSGD